MPITPTTAALAGIVIVAVYLIIWVFVRRHRSLERRRRKWQEDGR